MLPRHRRALPRRDGVALAELARQDLPRERVEDYADVHNGVIDFSKQEYAKEEPEKREPVGARLN